MQKHSQQKKQKAKTKPKKANNKAKPKRNNRQKTSHITIHVLRFAGPLLLNCMLDQVVWICFALGPCSLPSLSLVLFPIAWTVLHCFPCCLHVLCLFLAWSLLFHCFTMLCPCQLKLMAALSACFFLLFCLLCLLLFFCFVFALKNYFVSLSLWLACPTQV